MLSILHVMVASPAARIPSWQAERQPRPQKKPAKMQVELIATG
jgi:hypothetical protein